MRRLQLIPGEHIAFYEACVVEKNFDKGRRIMAAMLPLMDFLDGGKFVQSIKSGCELDGLKAGTLRAPLRPLNAEDKREARDRHHHAEADRRPDHLGSEP